MACRSGDSHLLRNPLRGHAGEREREAEGGGQEEADALGGHGGGLMGCVVYLLLLGPPFI
jgi:hypothetical protein